MRRQRDSLAFGETTITYTIHRGPRTTVRITVEPDGAIRVAAPRGMRRVKIAGYVRRKAGWLLKHVDEPRPGRQPPKRFVSGESFPYLGRHYQLKVQVSNDAQASLKLFGGRFWCGLPCSIADSGRTATVAGLLKAWYRSMAKRRLPDMVARYCRELDVPLPCVRLRRMRTQWASTSRGTIRFSWQVMMLSITNLEYVVAHEVCHLHHADHSRAFWRTLRRLLPDAESRRTLLAQYGRQLPDW
jgi:predicted metal-dependent hydrolase